MGKLPSSHGMLDFRKIKIRVHKCVASPFDYFNWRLFERQSAYGQRLSYTWRGKDSRGKNLTTLKWTCDNIYERGNRCLLRCLLSTSCA
ncbi:hypothetical protein CEXT_559371 [Caerostris extrusa]|uniref:Uncharacterized protein n=1 Tax=Caerostris extrusa TaxID=172846 RepID=A0AAV4S1E0_CAEEX|nr:hypothetical protein CEXT_559371 [Caerostris extrusa]